MTEAAVKVLRSGSVSEEAIKRGKAGLKAAILNAAENPLNIAEDIGQQALLKGSVDSTLALVAAVDSVSSGDVNNVGIDRNQSELIHTLLFLIYDLMTPSLFQAARKVASGKLSMAALGNISNVPFVDQLK